MGCTLADEYSSDGVERIEVLRGPGSFLYGTNALGGVINIIPKRMSSDGFSTHFSAGGGSFDSGILSLAQGGKIGRFDYYVTAGTRRTDGHREDGNDYYRGNHYTLHAGYEISPSLDLEFNGNLANLRMFDPGPVTAPAQNNWYNVKRGGSDLNLTAKTSYGETNVKLHTNMGYHDFYDDWHSWDRTTGLMIYHNASLWTGNSMTAGFDWINYGGHASDASGSYTPRYITETAPYLHMQQIFWGRLIASAGLRLEHHELYGNETLPKAGLVVQLSERTSFRVSASKGFRSPSIRELYFWMPANAELTPDRLWNKEVGLSHEFGNTMRVEADVFQVKGSNLIQFTAPPPKWMNGGSYTNTGYEVLWTWTPLPRLETGATWSDMKLDDAVFNAPGKKLTAYLRTKIGPVGLYASLLSIADWKGIDASSNLHDMPDYTVVNVSATAAVYHGMGVKLVVRNLFDASYQAMYGYPMPGRIFSTELDYGF
jgi:iron complex outermembrane receptor protein